MQKLDEPLTVVPLSGENADHGEVPVNWGFYRTGSTEHQSGKGAKTRMEKRAPQHGRYLTILTERGHLSASGPETRCKSNLTKVFEQNHKMPAPSQYVKQRDWTKNHEGKFLKKDRETFTEQHMREAKALTKACPGFYKQSEKPKDGKIIGHYKQAAKHRIIWDEFYAKGKAASKGPLYKTERRGKEFNRTPKMSVYPRERKDNVLTGWRIKKDSEPGPGSYDNNPPIKQNCPRPIWTKEKKVTYMETHMNKKKPIPAPGLYKGVESGIDKQISSPLKEFQQERLA